jgi:hypothetical protein
MKPLLWKEMHDLRGWLLAGFAVTGAVELLLLTKVFDPSFIAGWMIVLMPLTAAIVAIGMAVGQIASERFRRLSSCGRSLLRDRPCWRCSCRA